MRGNFSIQGGKYRLPGGPGDGRRIPMGKFGISFSGDSYSPFKVEKKLYTTHADLERIRSSDGRFQKTLAWASYFVLVFVALCVFNRPAVASVLSVGKSGIEQVIYGEQQLPWALRGIR